VYRTGNHECLNLDLAAVSVAKFDTDVRWLVIPRVDHNAAAGKPLKFRHTLIIVKLFHHVN